jgi:hypothetical protein
MNQITKLNIESRTRELKINGESERSIASILSKELNQKITQSSVHRYFANNAQVTQQAIESNDKLKVRVAESALDVIKEALMIVSNIKTEIRDARNFGADPARMSGLYAQWIKSLQLAAELLGDLKRPDVDINVNVQVNQQFNEFMQVVLKECDTPTKARISLRLKEKI